MSTIMPSAVGFITVPKTSSDSQPPSAPLLPSPPWATLISPPTLWKNRVVSTPDGLAAAATLTTLGNAKTVVHPTSIHDDILCAIDCMVSCNSKDHSTPVATVSNTAVITPIGSTDVTVRDMSGAHVPRSAYNCKIQQRVVAGSSDQPERAGANLVEHHRVSGVVNTCAHPHLYPDCIE
mmetsp:Transcript_97219/g.142277  ORF Transcript_97219/g.142277 Transcript_97219/m.142277 type:complete len:179 (+) Transcript_97219:23-559(+)